MIETGLKGHVVLVMGANHGIGDPTDVRLGVAHQEQIRLVLPRFKNCLEMIRP